MAKINVGDLVCMYRRRNKGMGIVLEFTSDIIESAEIEDLTFDEFYEVISGMASYNEKTEYRDVLQSKAVNPHFIKTCMLYNASWAKKPKKEFIRIRWFDTPSQYEAISTKIIEEWCPADWVRKISAT